jgi:hypothetical protein
MENIELLARAKKGQDLIVRDDQFEYSSILDATKICRERGHRLSLVDSGKLTAYELEWLGEAGADFYTSDGTRTDEREITLVNKACRKGGAVVAYLHRGAIEGQDGTGPISLSGLKELGRSGVYLHFSNKERQRKLSELAELAFSARKGGSWLVYYHHGTLDAELKSVAGNGAWIHLADSSLREEENLSLFLDIVRASINAGTNCVLHLERGLAADLLQDIFDAGGLILFKIALADFRSRLKTLERKANAKSLDFKTYYLYPKLFI